MISSTFKAAGCLLFIFCISICAQTPAKKTATGTITGKVTLKGEGLAGIIVGARDKETGRQPKPGMKVTTDSEGNYRISNVPPGTYEIGPGSPQFVLAGGRERKSLIVNEGETLDGIDFALVRGGVITGRVTDSEGRPVIEETVQISSPDGTASAFVSLNYFFSPTDDRGVYRIYGLPAGKYRVSAGSADERLYYDPSGRNHYEQTFHPSTTDPDKATLVEVTEGGETANIDIAFRKPQPTFIVTGKVVDADTGKAIPNAIYGLQRTFENVTQSNSGMITTKQGEFRFENVTPGKYAVFVVSSPDLAIYGEPVSFDVTDQNITGLLIKASFGNTVSGVIVVDGIEEQAARSLLNGMAILVESENAEKRDRYYHRPHSTINPDGSFLVTGTPPGLLEFTIYTDNRGGTACEIIRIERNGVIQTGQVELRDREQINDLRLIVRLHRGSIQGFVKFENGELLPNQRVQVVVRGLGDQEYHSSVNLDARGRFSLSGLKPGDYEIEAVAYLSGTAHKRSPMTKQQVVVVDNKVSEVTLTLDLGVKN